MARILNYWLKGVSTQDCITCRHRDILSKMESISFSVFEAVALSSLFESDSPFSIFHQAEYTPVDQQWNNLVCDISAQALPYPAG